MPQVGGWIVVEQLRAVVDAQHRVEQAATVAAERVSVAPVPGPSPEPAPPAGSEAPEVTLPPVRPGR